MTAQVQVFPLRDPKGQPTGQFAFRIGITHGKGWVVSEGYTRQRDAKRAASRFLVSIAYITAHETMRVANPDMFADVIEAVAR